jgi:hypothetical protein
MAEAPTFESFIEVQLDDVELNALEADLTSKLVTAYAKTALLLGWAQDGARVAPEEWPAIREALDDSITQLEQLKEIG